MKTQIFTRQGTLRTNRAIIVALAVAGFFTAVAAHADNKPAAKDAKSANASTNSADAELAIPLSVFTLTTSPTRDPFFPLSTRQAVPQSTNAAPSFSASCFVLKGISGAAGNRLAIVNNRTVGVGEDAEILGTSGKVKVHCVDIKESSVVLKIASQPELIEVSLRKSAQ